MGSSSVHFFVQQQTYQTNEYSIDFDSRVWLACLRLWVIQNINSKKKKIAGFNAGRKGMVFFLIILFVKYWTVLLVFQSTLILLFRSWQRNLFYRLCCKRWSCRWCWIRTAGIFFLHYVLSLIHYSGTKIMMRETGSDEGREWE